MGIYFEVSKRRYIKNNKKGKRQIKQCIEK